MFTTSPELQPIPPEPKITGIGVANGVIVIDVENLGESCVELVGGGGGECLAGGISGGRARNCSAIVSRCSETSR